MKRIFSAALLVVLLIFTVIALHKVDAQSPKNQPATTITATSKQ
ncbi:MAG TPA: hypothetical protein VLG16_05255 [Candidatus Saccharimonadales bacterium]|nr:hypothetical protein [Candidatus Saccharimonadales bacterium]